MKTTVVNMSAGEDWDVFIQRPSKWGNPYPLLYKCGDRVLTEHEAKLYCLKRYCVHHLLNHPELIEATKVELAGMRLGCGCKPSACHGDVLAEIANHVDDEAFERSWDRASGNADCVCGSIIYDHRPYMGHLITDGGGRSVPWLHVLCDGRLVKT